MARMLCIMVLCLNSIFTVIESVMAAILSMQSSISEQNMPRIAPWPSKYMHWWKEVGISQYSHNYHH